MILIEITDSAVYNREKTNDIADREHNLDKQEDR